MEFRGEANDEAAYRDEVDAGARVRRSRPVGMASGYLFLRRGGTEVVCPILRRLLVRVGLRPGIDLVDWKVCRIRASHEGGHTFRDEAAKRGTYKRFSCSKNGIYAEGIVNAKTSPTIPACKAQR